MTGAAIGLCLGLVAINISLLKIVGELKRIADKR
jgi:hypothetical protein